MPSGSTRINKALTNISVIYKNNEFIADKILGNVKVKKESDIFWVYSSEFRIPETLRANKARANMVTWSASTASYRCDEHALKDVVSDRDRLNADPPLKLDRDTTEYLTDKILLRQEYEAAKLLMTTGTWGNNTTLTTATSWDYQATTTSAPILNLLSATGKIIKSSGKRPNLIVMGWDVFEALKENNNVYGRIQYVERAILTENLLASLFDVDELHVGASIYDQSKEGGTESQTTIWGDDCLIGYFDRNPGLKKITSATNFRVSQFGNPYKVKKWRDEEIDGDYIQVQTMFKPRAVATACAYFFKACTLV